MLRNGLGCPSAGTHTNNMCCFDYGNSENDCTNHKSYVDGGMEAVYFGSGYGGGGKGPWVGADMENGIYGGKYVADPALLSPFVTAMIKGKDLDGAPCRCCCCCLNVREKASAARSYTKYPAIVQIVTHLVETNLPTLAVPRSVAVGSQRRAPSLSRLPSRARRQHRQLRDQGRRRDQGRAHQVL